MSLSRVMPDHSFASHAPLLYDTVPSFADEVENDQVIEIGHHCGLHVFVPKQDTIVNVMLLSLEWTHDESEDAREQVVREIVQTARFFRVATRHTHFAKSQANRMHDDAGDQRCVVVQ